MAIQSGGTPKPQGQWTPETPWLGPKKQTRLHWPNYVCRNPSCRSYGKSHPHCACGSPGARTDQSQNTGGEYSYAHGGEVHHCSTLQPHHESCPMFAEGGEVEANQEFENNPSLAVDHHIAHSGLLHALTKSGHSKSENEHKPFDDFLDSSRRGRKSVEHHTKNHFDKKHDDIETPKDDIEALKKHLDHLRENPGELLNVGGNLPESHGGALAAKAATATNYLNSIRPQQFQAGPMDDPMPAGKMDNQYYDRHLAIAQSPLSVLGHVRAGTVQPDDLNTLRNLYPHLADSLSNKTGAALIEAKTNGTEIPYKQKQGLSHLLSQPLDATMSPVAMRAIIASAKTPESPSQPGNGKKSGATAATQKTIKETDDLYKTPLDSRLAAQKQ